MSTSTLPVPPGAPVFSPFSVDSAPPTLPLPVTPSKDLDDEDLEQYMEIQQTDTARIEELVREATAGSTGSGKPEDGSMPSDPNECVICRRILSCRSALLMHYRTHTGERPYRCRLCGRTFTTKGNLKTHMAVHRGRISGLAAASGLHRCRVCRRDFPGAVALQQHIRSAHAPDVTPASNGPFSFPVSGAGGNAAATAAAAMMMIPGVSPLLPFFNFSSFYQAPRNLFPGAAGSGLVRVQDGDDNSGRELDLRKSSSVDRDTDDRSFHSDVNDDSRPASKRVKTENGGAGGDTSGHWQDNVEMTCNIDTRDGSSSNESPPAASIDETNCNEPVLRRDEVAPHTSAEAECGFSVNKGFPAVDVRRREDVRMSDNIQPPTTREEDHFPSVITNSDEHSDKFTDRVASKFASPLLALEERVNSLDYSMNMFSRFSVAAASVVNRDAEDAVSNLVGNGCDTESGDAEHDRSATVQDLRTHDYGLWQNEGDVSCLRQDDRLSTSSSAPRLVMSGQSYADVGLDDSASSGLSASPGVTVRPGSSGSGASSSQSGSALPSPALDVGNAVQSPSKMSASTPARFSCPVCAKPFASASALEIHSRTHSGDRPFGCHVCSKAFTTKGNLKVHMSTHAWNKCPSRRGRRMTVVDPAAAAAVAAASGAFSGSMSAPKDAATAAATAAFLTNTFGAGALPPPPMFGGFIPPPPGVVGNGAFLSDNEALVNYCMQAAAHGAGRESLALDTLRQTPSTAGFAGDWSGGLAPLMVKNERNNNARTIGSGSSAARVGGELDLSTRSNGSSVGVAASSFNDRQSSPGMRSWTSDRSSSLPLISNCT